MSKIIRTINLHLTKYTGIRLPVFFNDYSDDMEKIDEAYGVLKTASDDYAGRINILETGYTSLSESVTNHGQRIAAIEEVIHTVSTQNIMDLQARLGALENKVQTNTTNIHEINDNLDEINSNITTLGTNLNATTGRVTTVEGRVTTLEDCCVEVRDRLTATEIATSKNADDIGYIQQRLTRDEANIQGNSDDIVILSAQVATNAHNIDDITHALDDLDPSSQLEIVRQVSENTTAISQLQDLTTVHTQRLDGYATRFTQDELRITDLERRMTTAEDALEQVGDWQEQIDTLTASVDDVVNVQIPALTTLVNGYDSRITALETWKTGTVDDFISNTGTTLTGYGNRISALEAEDVLIDGRLDTVEGDITTMLARFVIDEGNITALDNRVTALETQVGNVDISTWGASVTAAVAEAFSRIATLVSTKQDKVWINVKDFGAVGDGVTDDTSAIQSAIATMRSGDTLYFPKGTYIVSQTLRYTYNNISIIGDFPHSVVQLDPTIDHSIALMAYSSDGYTRHGLRMNGMILRGTENYGRPEDGCTLFDIWCSNDITIENCTFQNNMNAGVRLLNGASNVRVAFCRFEAIDCGIIELGTHNSDDVHIRDCYFSGYSSYNSFANFNSENISLFHSGEGTSKRWVIENCVMEHKLTNGITFAASNFTHQDNSPFAENCVIRNITFHAMTGCILLNHSKNITVENIYRSDTAKNEQELGIYGTSLGIARGCENITVNHFIDDDTHHILSPISVSNYTHDIKLKDIIVVNTANNNPAMLLSGEYITIEDAVVYPSSNEIQATIQMSNLTHSYIDVRGDKQKGIAVVYYAPDHTNVTNNIFIIDTDNDTGRNFGASYTTVDTNKWNLTGKKVASVQAVNSQYEQYTLSARYVIRIYTQETLTSSEATKNFYLLNNNQEIQLEFVNTSFTTGKTFTFATGGNIIAIPESFAFSDDYKVVCKFKQISGKWVEVHRLLEYYEGETIDVNVKTLQDDVSGIQDVIPSGASSSNKLVTQDELGDSVFSAKNVPNGVTSMNQLITPGLYEIANLSDMPGTGHYGNLYVYGSNTEVGDVGSWCWQIFTNTSDNQMWIRNAINYTSTPPTNWSAWKLLISDKDMVVIDNIIIPSITLTPGTNTILLSDYNISTHNKPWTAFIYNRSNILDFNIFGDGANTIIIHNNEASPVTCTLSIAISHYAL